MNTAMTLTLDGLVRALRTRMHRMADEIESGYARPARPVGADLPQTPESRMDDDDVGGD